MSTGTCLPVYYEPLFIETVTLLTLPPPPCGKQGGINGLQYTPPELIRAVQLPSYDRSNSLIPNRSWPAAAWAYPDSHKCHHASIVSYPVRCHTRLSNQPIKRHSASFRTFITTANGQILRIPFFNMTGVSSHILESGSHVLPASPKAKAFPLHQHHIPIPHCCFLNFRYSRNMVLCLTLEILEFFPEGDF